MDYFHRVDFEKKFRAQLSVHFSHLSEADREAILHIHFGEVARGYDLGYRTGIAFAFRDPEPIPKGVA